MNAYLIDGGAIPYPDETRHDTQSAWIIYADSSIRAVDIFIQHWWISKHPYTRWLFHPKDLTIRLLEINVPQKEGWARDVYALDITEILHAD